MLSQLVSRISAALDPAGTSVIASLDIERVTTLLLVEIARADHDIEPAERLAIVAALNQSSNLTATEIDDLVTEALEDADRAISLHQHVQLVNDHFSQQDKRALVEQMWRVAFADGNVDGYEEYTIRKLCDLLYVKHRDFMQAKLHVMEQT